MTENEETGRMDATLAKKEIVLGYSDNEVLSECRNSCYFSIDEFEIEARATPTILNGQRIVVWAIDVTYLPMNSSLNGQENGMPF